MRFALIIVVLVLVLGGGGFGLLVLDGTIKLGAAKPVPAKPREIPAGMTLVPWNLRTLPAYTQMTRELLVNPKTGELIREPVDLKALQSKGVLTDAAQIIGRVLRHEKRPGY